MTETKRAEETKKELRLDKEIEIAAPVQEVWEALTDPKELVKWFPLEARVTPGDGKKDCEPFWRPEEEDRAQQSRRTRGKRRRIAVPA